MLERVKIDGSSIQLPTLYIAKTQDDIDQAQANGIPYIVWRWSSEELIRNLLRPTLEKMFPYINWNKVLGWKKELPAVHKVIEHEESKSSFISNGKLPDNYESTVDDSKIEDHEFNSIASDSERIFSGTGSPVECCLDIEDYMGDMNSYVDIEVLQQIKLMPSFIGDIIDNIRINLSAQLRWQEGYNKKHGACTGKFSRMGQAPNLIIIDVSMSIPVGIAATMLQLCDTLRNDVHADLIITGANSGFYAHGDKLPSPNDLRRKYGRSNESYDFNHILQTKIAGKKYGHVFSFGDDDTPDLFEETIEMIKNTTEVQSVHHYHTNKYHWNNRHGINSQQTGYAKWCDVLQTNHLEEDVNTNWCSVIYDND